MPRAWTPSAGPSLRVRGAVRARRRGRSARRNHPRGCGKQSGGVMDRPTTRGPSPRVRGADARPSVRRHRLGTIPAGAGSRHCRPPASRWRRDHPRGCGEQSELRPGKVVVPGPSPRVRGAGYAGDLVDPVDGTIPAGAGSSALSSTSRTASRDHPRGCGEQNSFRSAPSLALGPSPRVRGAVVHPSDQRHVPGTIPAGAGSRLFDLQVYSRRSVFSGTLKDSGKLGIAADNAMKAERAPPYVNLAMPRTPKDR